MMSYQNAELCIQDFLLGNMCDLLLPEQWVPKYLKDFRTEAGSDNDAQQLGQLLGEQNLPPSEWARCVVMTNNWDITMFGESGFWEWAEHVFINSGECNTGRPIDVPLPNGWRVPTRYYRIGKIQALVFVHPKPLPIYAQ